jgi:CubicO group peptidase (beta-lactamase class C family)
MLRLRPPTLLALLSAASAASATGDLDDLMRAELQRQGAPGVALAVVRDGRIVKQAGYGLANLELQAPVRPETIFQSGSIGKQFTAALVLLLADDGLLGLDDPVSKHLPGTPASWRKVTIRMLLHHTSGLADPYAVLDLQRNYTDAELLKIYGRLPTLFEPGTAFSYSNMGYHVLGFMCSRVGKRFYGDQVIDRVFRPAGMKTARMISETDIVANRAAGYELVDGKLRNQAWVAPTLNSTGDGSYYLSVLDFAAWDVALDGDVPLKESLRELMWTPGRLANGKTVSYGLAWSLEPFEGHPAASHGGAWQGFLTTYVRLQDQRLSVVVLTNSNAADPEAFARIAAHHYLSGGGP